jgi:hypothetical protein
LWTLDWLPGGLVTFQLEGVTGQEYGIEGSTNLLDWIELFRTNAPADFIELADPEALTFPRRFYRAQHFQSP